MDQQKHARPVQRQARGIQRIASILDAAESVFAAMGYDEATTNHIAAQAQQYDSNLRVRGQTNRPSQEYSQILGKS